MRGIDSLILTWCLMIFCSNALQHYKQFCLQLQLLQRRNGLHEKAARRRHALEESYKNQMFERDYDETKIWINEKLKAASDYEGYLV